MRRNLFSVILLAILLAGMTFVSAQTVTEENLLGLIRSNASEQMITQAISMAKVIQVDTSFENLPNLMKKGVSQVVLTALVDRKEQLGASKISPSPTVSPVAKTGLATITVPDKTGVYVQTPSGLIPLRAETTKTKTTSPMKVMAFGALGGIKTQGVLDGPKSPVQLSGPEVVLIVRILEGVDVDSLQLFPLNSKKDHREFTVANMSFFKGQSIGPSDSAKTKFEEIGPNTYKATLSLKSGEYGIMAQSSRSPYTFGVY
jgi:hypothetical protein